MAWEWTGPVATGAVGIAGMTFAYFTARRSGDVALQMAREERQQNRKERAYLEIQRAVEISMNWLESAAPDGAYADDYDPFPEHPATDAQRIEAAALQLYWSKEVRPLVAAWTAALKRFSTHVNLARAREEARPQIWEKAPDMKQAARGAADALLNQMNKELVGEPDAKPRKIRRPR